MIGFLSGGGCLGALIRTFDWAATSVGPIETWPLSLMTAVGFVVHSSVPMVMLWGEDGVMIYNDAYSVFAESRHPQLLGSKVREGWAEVAAFNDNVMKVCLAGGTLAYKDQELTLNRRGVPERAWMNLDYSPLFADDGEPAGVIAIVVETTERVLADRRNAAERDRLNKMFEQAPGFMAILEGPDHRITLANDAYAALVGRHGLIGLPARQALPEIEGQGFFERLDTCLATGEPFVGVDAKVTLNRGPDGQAETRFVDFVFQPIVETDGRISGVFLEGSDVTDRVDALAASRDSEARLEGRVGERTSELEAANRQLLSQIEERERIEATLQQMQRLKALGQLTAGVAHDFNNLLTVVLGNIDLLERTLPATDERSRTSSRLATMRTAAERGATLTAQLLAFSRRQRLEARPIDLNATVLSMNELLQSSMGGSVHLETGLDADLWPALADATQLELVILNLAINARDAMEVGGSLTIRTANVACGAPEHPGDPPAGDHVMVAVADSGTGMAPDVLAKAYEPFFTTKPVGKGSGLGLAQVFGFAKQSGGGVRIETQMGVGTTVRVFLPRSLGLHTELAGPVGPPSVGRIRGRPRRILVVDDDNAVREITTTTLKDLGCEVIEAGSGGAALDHLDDKGALDLMIVDYAMPGMNGAEVAREVRARRPDLPILFVTGYADQSALAAIGEDRIVQKPFRSGELAGKVRRLLQAGWSPLPTPGAIQPGGRT